MSLEARGEHESLMTVGSYVRKRNGRRVLPYQRRTPIRIGADVRLGRLGVIGANAYTVPWEDSRTIYLPPVPSDEFDTEFQPIEQVLAHESLHQVVHKRVGLKSARALDTVARLRSHGMAAHFDPRLVTRLHTEFIPPIPTRGFILRRGVRADRESFP